MEAPREEITKLYISLFGRAPDLEGLDFWSSKLLAGESVASVAEQMYSVEPARRFFPQGQDMSEVVNAFYRNVLGREADQGGLEYWVEQLNSGKSIGDVLSTIVGATDGYNGSDPDGLISARLFANKKAVSDAYVRNLSESGVSQTNQAATSIAVSIIDQVTPQTVLADFLANTVRKAAELTQLALQRPEEVQKLLPASGSWKDLTSIMPDGSRSSDVFDFAKRLLEIADSPEAILEIVSVGSQGRLTFSPSGDLVNRYGEIMVLDSSGNLAPAPRDVPVGMMRDASGNIVPDPSFPTVDLFGNPIAPPGYVPPPPPGTGGTGSTSSADSTAPATTDGRVVMTNQGPLAYDDAGQLVNRYGEVMVLDSSGNWAPAPRDVPVGMVSDGAGGFTPDPNFTTDIFGNSVTQPYDTSTDYSSLSPVVDGYTSAYSAPPPAPTEEKSTEVEIVGSQPA